MRGYLSFDEYKNHAVGTLHREAGEPFFCYHDPKGLPYKIMYFPIAPDFFPGREDEPSDLNVKMQLIAAQSGQGLYTYLTETLGLNPDIDFQRHANGKRGGPIYFDMLTDTAIDTLMARAAEVGRASVADRLKTRGLSSQSDGRE